LLVFGYLVWLQLSLSACIPCHSFNYYSTFCMHSRSFKNKKVLTLSLCILSLFSLVGLVSFFFIFVPPSFKVWFFNCSQVFHFVHIWSCFNFSWFLGLNFLATQNFHIVEISCCRAFWFEFLWFCFFLYICLQSQVFCFHTCMFGVVSFWPSMVLLTD